MSPPKLLKSSWFSIIIYVNKTLTNRLLLPNIIITYPLTSTIKATSLLYLDNLKVVTHKNNTIFYWNLKFYCVTVIKFYYVIRYCQRPQTKPYSKVVPGNPEARSRRLATLTMGYIFYHISPITIQRICCELKHIYWTFYCL